MLVKTMKKFGLKVLPGLILCLSAAACAAVSTIDNLREASIIPVQSTDQSSAWLVASESRGLVLLDENAQPLFSLKGAYGLLDSRDGVNIAGKSHQLAITLRRDTNQAELIEVSGNGLKVLNSLPIPSFKVEDLCLYQDSQAHLYVFMVDGRGQAEQWLLVDGVRGELTNRLIRQINLPPEAKFCSVDDVEHTLYVSEEAVGIWALDASPEGEAVRSPVALLSPFGSLHGEIGGIAAVPGGIMVMDNGAGKILGFKKTSLAELEDAKAVPAPVWSGQQLAIEEADGLALGVIQGNKTLAVLNDKDNARAVLAYVDWIPAQSQQQIPYVLPVRQTPSVPHYGDAADDPAIWIHPENPALSRVLGTNKQAGLYIYDLEGNEVQQLNTGRLNNVDVRQQVAKGTARADIAIASKREDNSLALYEIDRATGILSEPAFISTALNEIYGICLYQSADKTAFAFVNDKDGRYLQVALQWRAGAWQGDVVREFNVPSQPEGCVVDDNRQRLFVGEEDEGVWVIGANADDGQTLTPVIMKSDILVPDIEGLALYHGPEQSFLVVSSQGDNSYLVLEAEAPYTVLGSFRVGLHPQLGIDGSSETDGLEVTSVNLGGDFQQGMLIVQDGHNVMPAEPQNFKYIPWHSIMEALQPVRR